MKHTTPTPWASTLSEPGELSQEQWEKALGPDSWRRLSEPLREGFLACSQPEGKMALAKAFKGHLISWEAKGWSGPLGERAMVDCLRALMPEHSERALAAGEALAGQLRAEALSKRRGWGSYAEELCLAEALCQAAGEAVKKRPGDVEMIDAGARRWAKVVGDRWAPRRGQAASRVINGAMRESRGLEMEQAEAALELAARALGWFAKGPEADGGAKEEEWAERLADAARSLVERACPGRRLSAPGAQLLERAWRSLAREGGFDEEPSLAPVAHLMLWPCEEEAAGASVRLAEVALELGIAPKDSFKTLGRQALEHTRESFKNALIETNHGLRAWVAKLIQEGMDPSALNEHGVSLLCALNDRIRECQQTRRPTGAFEAAAAELLAAGVDPALVAPRIDPLERAAAGAMRGMVMAAMERQELERLAPQKGVKKRAPGM